MPACDRCRSFKKKCSRSLPACALCAAGGHICRYARPSDPRVHNQQLRARIEWLSRYLNKHPPPGGFAGKRKIDEVETGTDLDAAGDPGSRTCKSPRRASYSSRNTQTSRTGTAPVATLMSMPDPSAGREFVHAYFRHVGRSYPCVDPGPVWASFSAALRDPHQGEPMAKSDRKRTILFLVMAIGFATLQRAKELPPNAPAAFEVPYCETLHDCLLRPDLVAVQILVLLSICSLDDPCYAGSWTLMTIAAREGLRLGLGRRSGDKEKDDSGENERHHRLFWSIFCLDRRMATALGVPPTLYSEDTDIPLPGLTIDEFVVSGRGQLASMLQISHQAIQLGLLEERILQATHLQKPLVSASLSNEARRHIVKRIRLHIENWYMQYCILARGDDSEKVSVQNSISWISARYYYLLMLLYYPTYFNLCSDDFATSSEPADFASKYVQSIGILMQQHQLHLSRLTLCRLLAAALMLTYGLGHVAPHPDKDNLALLIEILEAFDGAWTHAHQAAHILRDLIPHVSDNRKSQTRYYDYGHANSTAKAKRLWTDLLGVVQDVLGPSSSFCWALAERMWPQSPNHGRSVNSHSSGNEGVPSSFDLHSDSYALGSLNSEPVTGLGNSWWNWRTNLFQGNSLWQSDI
ncbi:hypothetical protein VTK73DRAFT_9370 [Phialemonium thermophilum]|uniref:Zn(2)-C6 fungal-type domain-containing protein n=1 Tax=Phialemonium thermophilum TaxID=223376 RepID=A0ABR3W2V3_9PEZI